MLDIEKEICATLTDSRAMLTYYEQGVRIIHFADPVCCGLYAFSLDYFVKYGSIERAATGEVIRSHFPQYDSVIQGTRGAAPGYLADQIKQLYVKRSVEEAIAGNYQGLSQNPLNTAESLRDSFFKITDSCVPRNNTIIYGEDTEAYRKAMQRRRTTDGFPVPFPTVQAHTGGIKKGDFWTIVGPAGYGKSQPLSSKVLTINGWKKMGDIVFGDMVATRRGDFAPVVGIHPQGFLDVYEIEFDDGRKVRCSRDHLFAVRTKTTRNKRNSIKTVGEILDRGLKDHDKGEDGWLWRVPLCQPIQFPDREVPLDPYACGFFITSGTLDHNSVSVDSANSGCRDSLERAIGRDFSVGSFDTGLTIRPTGYLIKHYDKKTRDALAGLGFDKLNYMRKIPDRYLYGGYRQRFAFLQGVVDFNGRISGHGKYQVDTTSSQLARDILELCHGLGYRASMEKRGTYRIICRINIYTDHELFRSPFLKDRWIEHTKRAKPMSYDAISIVGIRKLEEKELMQCIRLDDPEHLYLTDGCIVTHNTNLACRFALEGIRSNWNVYFASLELTPTDVVSRIEYMEVNRERTVVPIFEYSHGVEKPEYSEAIELASKSIEGYPGKLIIDQPRIEDRTPEKLVQLCKSHKCNMIIIDQLQFVTKPKMNSTPESVGAALQEFKQQIMSPADGRKIPMLLLHQMNRAGVEEMKKKPGCYGSMEHISHSSWVEQLSDCVFGIGRNKDEASCDIMNFGTLKTRNFDPIALRLDWELHSSYQIREAKDENGHSMLLDAT